jgi:hypothetical protein
VIFLSGDDAAAGRGRRVFDAAGFFMIDLGDLVKWRISRWGTAPSQASCGCLGQVSRLHESAAEPGRTMRRPKAVEPREGFRFAGEP